MLALAACGSATSGDMSAEEVAAELHGLRIEPGLWEVRSEVLDATGPNLPRVAQARIKGPRPAVRTCITPAQAARPEANFLRTQPDSNCVYRGFSLRGGRLRGEMRCTGGGLPGTTTTSMSGQYGARGYRTRMLMVSTGMPFGANMTIDTRIIGRRIGACPPAPQTKEGST